MIVQHFFKDTPTFFALSYFGLYLDYCYPKGGTGTLAKLVTDYIRRSGGEILTDTAVTEVETDKKLLLTNKGETLKYKKLVWAADQKFLYSCISSIHTKKAEMQRKLTENGSGGDSILSLFVGFDYDKDYFESKCGAHAFYTPSTIGLSSLKNWNVTAETEESLYEWIKQYLECTTYEISCPVLRDSTLAPQGKTGVIISTLMDYHLVKHIADIGSNNYDKFKDYCQQKIIDVLDATIFPGLSKKVEFVLCSTPLTIERETGNTHGAITGWSFTNKKLPSENRFKKIRNSIKNPIDDVYQCGQWTFSPSGLPVSILTGKLAADEIHKTLKGTVV